MKNLFAWFSKLLTRDHSPTKKSFPQEFSRIKYKSHFDFSGVHGSSSWAEAWAFTMPETDVVSKTIIFRQGHGDDHGTFVFGNDEALSCAVNSWLEGVPHYPGEKPVRVIALAPQSTFFYLAKLWKDGEWTVWEDKDARPNGTILALINNNMRNEVDNHS